MRVNQEIYLRKLNAKAPVVNLWWHPLSPILLVALLHYLNVYSEFVFSDSGYTYPAPLSVQPPSLDGIDRQSLSKHTLKPHSPIIYLPLPKPEAPDQQLPTPTLINNAS